MNSTSLVKQKTRHLRIDWQCKSFRVMTLLGCFEIILAVFIHGIRPWYQTWGATPEEQHQVLPGDLMIPRLEQETRAITINAPATTVWQWVAQLGQDRGGFYSYDLLENVAGCEMPREDYLRPEKQQWKTGDKLWMYPPRYGIEITGAPLVAYIPGRALSFATTKNEKGDSRWTFAVNPIDESHSRLIVRGQGPADESVFGFIFNRAVFEAAHFVMEKRTMIGIKDLAEGRSRGRFWNHVQVSLWTITLGLWISSIVFVMRRQNWLRAIAGFMATGFAFQWLTFGQPPVWVATPLVILLAWILYPSSKTQQTALRLTVR